MENTEEESRTGIKQDEEEHRSKREDEVILIYLKWHYELTSFEFVEQFMILYHAQFILKTDRVQKVRLEEFKRLVDLKAALRQSNLNPERPGIIFLLGTMILFMESLQHSFMSLIVSNERKLICNYASPI